MANVTIVSRALVFDVPEAMQASALLGEHGSKRYQLLNLHWITYKVLCKVIHLDTTRTTQYELTFNNCRVNGSDI